LNLIQGMFHHHPGKSGTGHLKSNGGNGKKRRGKMGNKMGIMKLNYVNITAKDCDGWLNLFVGEHCLCLVNNAYLADHIRAQIPEKSYEDEECSCGCGEKKPASESCIFSAIDCNCEKEVSKRVSQPSLSKSGKMEWLNQKDWWICNKHGFKRFR